MKELEAIDAYTVFEWQKRGQPHLHMLIWNSWNLYDRVEWYQTNITAEPSRLAMTHNKIMCYAKNKSPMNCIIYTKDQKLEYCRYGFGCAAKNMKGRPLHKNWEWIETLTGKVLDPPRNEKNRNI